MFTNETFRNALIDDVLVARVLCSLTLSYSKLRCGKLCVSVGGFAIVPQTLNSAEILVLFFLLSSSGSFKFHAYFSEMPLSQMGFH